MVRSDFHAAYSRELRLSAAMFGGLFGKGEIERTSRAKQGQTGQENGHASGAQENVEVVVRAL